MILCSVKIMERVEYLMKNKDFFCMRNVIISFLLFMFMYYLINNSSFGLSKLLEITGGQSILDMEMMKGYSVDRAYEIFEALGETGRAFNLKYIIPLDFPFPLTYGLFYFMTITFLVKKQFEKMKKPWMFGLVGLLPALFDWLENIMVIQLLLNYPERLEGIVKMASLFTQFKSFFIMGSMILIIMGLLGMVYKKYFLKSIS